jgi:hypothetical protein
MKKIIFNLFLLSLVLSLTQCGPKINEAFDAHLNELMDSASSEVTFYNYRHIDTTYAHHDGDSIPTYIDYAYIFRTNRNFSHKKEGKHYIVSLDLTLTHGEDMHEVPFTANFFGKTLDNDEMEFVFINVNDTKEYKWLDVNDNYVLIKQ